MKGDFTRGHRPDGKRGQRFTRGLLQQRRLLLDSDVNAAVEAFHERMRDLASDLGCPKGSPDLGFLVTPESIHPAAGDSLRNAAPAADRGDTVAVCLTRAT